MAAVSDRGTLAELLSVLSILWAHLSRLSEDFILWNSEAFGYVELDDAFATGSSLMPQKKNPDVFELVRGRAGVIFGYLQAILTVQKGLPLSYNRDLQEDKPGVFDAVKKTATALELLALAVGSASWHKKALLKSLDDDSLFATDILEYLVRKKVPFSEAHELVGRTVRHAIESEKRLREWPVQEWRKFSPKFGADIHDLFSASESVKGKKTIGSTHPARVKQTIAEWKKTL
jgi:argininosuccinate lyase